MKRPMVLAIALVFATCFGIGTLLGDRDREQPYPYNHAVHTAKADCALCHRGVRTRAQAGLPGMIVCAGCHATAPGASPTKEHRALWKRIRGGKAPQWNRLFRLPTHVFFSHRRHVTVAGIKCDKCHGDMEHRKSPPRQALVKLHMRDCIGCHEARDVTVDCTACHR